MSVRNGGAAFPHPDGSPGPHGDWMWHENCGMSLRDYAAIHSVQPGCGEIASMAGVVYCNGRIWKDKDTEIGNFDNWFNEMPLDRRLDLFAAVKYAMADAMIRAREVKS